MSTNPIRILVVLLFSVFVTEGQTISNLQYSIMLKINDNFPQNAANMLDEKGFVLLGQEEKGNEIQFTYALKSYDKYYYNVILSKIGGQQQIVLTFNENAREKEYEPFVKNIKTYMTLQPKEKNGDSRFTVYKDNSGYYYAYYPDYENKIYMICIMNYSSYYRFYVKDK